MNPAVSQDEEHLKLLAIFHYVLAGITVLFSLFPVIHLIIGLSAISGNLEDPSDTEALPAAFGWFFVLFGLMAIACGLILAVVFFLSGRCLQQRRRRIFCLVSAGLMCAFMPFGTVLGVFTIIVLVKDSVKALFEAPSRGALE